MKGEKFIVIPILIVAYIYFVNSILVPSITSVSPILPPSGGEGQAIRIGTSVSILQTRLYFFGLIRLPVRIEGVDFNDMHNLFFFLIYCLIIFFICLEIIAWKYSRRDKNVREYKMDTIG